MNIRLQLGILNGMASKALASIVAFSLLSGCGQGQADVERDGPRFERVGSAKGPLKKIKMEAGDLLAGGEKAFKRRLEQLRGYQVVVNKWASWCAPCKAEFPIFLGLSHKLGGRVAFLGVNSADSATKAREFLAQHQIEYPSYFDPDQKIAATMEATQAFPSTVFYSSQGELVQVHPGVYTSEKDLEADIERYGN